MCVVKELRTRQLEYCTFQETELLVCTWNVGACKPPSVMEHPEFWQRWLGCAASPSMIVVGLQEVIELDSKRANARIILGNPKESRFDRWTERIREAVLLVHRDAKYRMVISENLVGLLLVVLVRDDLVSYVDAVACDRVKTGLGGLHGNKGSLVARLVLRDASFCFINAHLAAGHEKVASRNSDAGMIMRTAKFTPASVNVDQIFTSGGEGTSVDDLEHCFFFGDLNYRIDGSRTHVLDSIEAGLYEPLSVMDQLSSQLCSNPASPFAHFQEGALTFPPTYKFDPNSRLYDTSEKMRVPGWCDRILYRCNTGVILGKVHGVQTYTSVGDMLHSDHRPVCAVVRVPVRVISHDAYRSTRSKLIDI